MSNYCPDCGRLKDTGCACGLTFAEKMKTLQFNEPSLKYGPRRGRRFAPGKGRKNP